MARVVTLTFRITPQREAQLRKELNLPDRHQLTSLMIYYAINDTVCAWLDGGQESDLSDIAEMDDDGRENERPFTPSDRPYKVKQTLKIRRKKRQN